MKNIVKPTVTLLALFFTAALFAQETENEIRLSAIQMKDSLTVFQKKRALLSFSDTARIKWNNLPVGLRARVGINIGSMSEGQRKLLHRMLCASLSSQGYLKATSIMHLDNLLNLFVDTMYQRKEISDSMYQFMRELKWSHENYYLAFFGDPASDANWGYKLEGHHLSLNFTFRNNRLSVTPLFVGTDPAEYPIMQYAGWRVLSKEEDCGLKLLHSLSLVQKKKALLSAEVPGDIITSAESGRRLVDYWGIPSRDLNAAQKETMKSIIREFVFNLAYNKALVEYDKILKAGMEHIYFGWIGAEEEKKPHYYILNGPTFIIEFDNNGGPRKAANHIHAIWREKGKEFGEDVLKQHYQLEHMRKD